MQLKQEQIETYQDQDFLVLKDFVSYKLCEILRQRADQLVSEFETKESVGIFTTNDQTLYSDQYFIESGDKVRLFSKRKHLIQKGFFLFEE